MLVVLDVEAFGACNGHDLQQTELRQLPRLLANANHKLQPDAGSFSSRGGTCEVRVHEACVPSQQESSSPPAGPGHWARGKLLPARRSPGLYIAALPPTSNDLPRTNDSNAFTANSVLLLRLEFLRASRFPVRCSNPSSDLR
jgi:hypothetical protein